MKTKAKKGQNRKTKAASGRARPKAPPAKAPRAKARVAAKPAPRPPARTPPRPPEPVKVPPSRTRAVAAPENPAQAKQQRAYQEAVQLFQIQKYGRAEGLFRKVQQGPDRALAHRAGVHLRICEQRLRPPQVKLHTVEDRYNYAVTLINARRLAEADQLLQTALQQAPRADHVHYALAAARALQGNTQGAYEHLKTAIELQPRNRILARSDPDFADLLSFPPVALLLLGGSSPRAI